MCRAPLCSSPGSRASLFSHIFPHCFFLSPFLWTGKFKDLHQGTGDYVLSPQVWEAIGEATAASGSTIPSAYGAQPQNVTQDKSQINADSWSFWAMYLGPVLL